MKSIQKSIILILSLLTISTALYSQKWGVDAGYTMTGLQQSHEGKSGDFNLLSGFHVGPRMDFYLTKPESLNKWMLGASLLFEMRAGRCGSEWMNDYTTYTRILYYGVLPIDVTYYMNISEKNKLNLLLYGGPRLSMGIFGEINEHYYMGTREQFEDKHPFDGSLNRFDVGFGIGVGMQYKFMVAKLSYDFPITNSANEAEPETLKQHLIKFTLGYSFDLKKKKR